MNKYKRYASILSIVGLLLILTGVTYSFFNYTRTGEANSVRVGRISFNATQTGTLSLTNVFPMSRSEIDNNLQEGNNVAITITGDTTYDEGVEYLVTAEDVNISINDKKIPVSLYITGTSDLGDNDEDYFDNRGGNTSIHKVLSGGILHDGQYLLVGYIAKGQTGVNGNLNIKAFIDKNLILISDTYDGSESDEYGTPNSMAEGKTVFTTSEWNSLNGNNALSFKVRVEANEGVWVDPYTTPNLMNTINFNRNGANITEIRFIHETPLRMQRRYDASPGVESNGTKGDITYQDTGKVLAWIEPTSANPTGANNELLNIKPKFLGNEDNETNIKQIDNETSYILYIASSGKTEWVTGSGLFAGFSNVEKITFENVDSSNVTDMGGMFYNCSSLVNVNISALETDRVVYMNSMFYGNSNLTSVDLSGLGSNNLTRISNMFYNCNALTEIIMKNFNFGTVNFYQTVNNYSNYYYAFAYLPNVETIDLTNANTSGVTNMFDMFYNCQKLKTVILEGIDISNVTDMSYMFAGCANLEELIFNSVGGNLNTMNGMFSGCTKLTTLSLIGQGGDNLSGVDSVFYNCTSLKNINMSNFNFGTVNFDQTNIFYPLKDCLETINLSGANFSGPNVTTNSFYNLFEYSINLKSVDLSNANTSKVTIMTDMFDDCKALESVNMNGIDTSNVTDMSYMFADCESITSLDLRHLNTSKVTNMAYMFKAMDNLEYIDISGWGNNNLNRVYAMFSGADKLETIVMNNFNFGNSTSPCDPFASRTSLKTLYLNGAIFPPNSSSLFSRLSSLENLYINNVDTSNVTDMGHMFYGCISLISIDISSFSTSNVTDMSSMFRGCTNVKTIYVGNSWNVNGVTSSDGMFGYDSIEYTTNLIGGAGTTFDSNYLDKTYAHVDGGPSNPGYFTLKTS